MKNFIDLEIKKLDRDEVPSNLDCKHFLKVYYLRYRYFIPDADGNEFEYVFSSLGSCLLKLVQLLLNYYHLCYERANNN